MIHTNTIANTLVITCFFCFSSITAFTAQPYLHSNGFFAAGGPESESAFLQSSQGYSQSAKFLKLYAVDIKNDEQEQQKQQEEAKDIVKSEDVGDNEEEEEEEEDEDEYELVEYENLTEFDFFNSEWKVGTNWNNRKQKVDLTWVRLIVDENNKNVAIWGTGAKGTWKLDESAQFISISQESWGGWTGKKIWAGPMDDYYYMQGTVRGWNPISPASVLGLWQMIRLGVDKEEAGTAPWLEEEEDKDE